MGGWRRFLKFLVVIAQAAILLALWVRSEQPNSESNLKVRLTSTVSGSDEIPSWIKMDPSPHTCRTDVSYSGSFVGKGKWHGGNLPAAPYSLDDDSGK
jgi:hypothetical protein